MFGRQFTSRSTQGWRVKVFSLVLYNARLCPLTLECDKFFMCETCLFTETIMIMSLLNFNSMLPLSAWNRLLSTEFSLEINLIHLTALSIKLTLHFFITEIAGLALVISRDRDKKQKCWKHFSMFLFARQPRKSVQINWRRMVAQRYELKVTVAQSLDVWN